jgi:hypothetical protein
LTNYSSYFSTQAIAYFVYLSVAGARALIRRSELVPFFFVVINIARLQAMLVVYFSIKRHKQETITNGVWLI